MSTSCCIRRTGGWHRSGFDSSKTGKKEWNIRLLYLRERFSSLSAPLIVLSACCIYRCTSRMCLDEEPGKVVLLISSGSGVKYV